jgi:hypothetical protein
MTRMEVSRMLRLEVDSAIFVGCFVQLSRWCRKVVSRLGQIACWI